MIRKGLKLLFYCGMPFREFAPNIPDLGGRQLPENVELSDR